MATQKAKPGRRKNPPNEEKFELLAVIGTRKFWRFLKIGAPKIAGFTKFIASSLKPTGPVAKFFRKILALARRKGIIFYLLAVLWAWAAFEAAELIRQFHPAPRSGNSPDNLISAHASTAPHYSLASDFWQLAAILGLVMLLLLAVVAIRRARWRKIIGVLNLAAIIFGFLFIQASMIHTNDQVAAFTNAYPEPMPLSQEIDQRAMCGDAVQTLDNYGFGAKYFYELKDAGWRLAATYKSYSGNLDSAKNCELYYSIRAKYPAKDILLQLYTKNSAGEIMPYTYTNENMGHGFNGIFVKN